MKTRQEINIKILELQTQGNLLFTKKRKAENESVTMRQIDESIDGLGKQIGTLQWVLNNKTK